jgi:hypothetical protein
MVVPHLDVLGGTEAVCRLDKFCTSEYTEWGISPLPPFVCGA